MTVQQRYLHPAYVLLLIVAPVLSGSAWGETKLPKPSFTGNMPVEAAIVAKKTARNFGSTPLTLGQVSQLLWSANGNTSGDATTGATAKVTPSAGALYPLEIFLITGNDTVTGLTAGVYKYDPVGNSLETISSGDSRASVAQAALSQMWLARAPALIVIAADFGRTTSKYGPRGTQYVFMEAGNSNQNIYLQATALGLRVGTVGAFHDNLVMEAIKLPKGISPILIVAVGK